jgi:hypothetical protein
MRRRGIPTLYELARGSTGAAAGVEGVAARQAPAFIASAMRSIRVPMGFVWLIGVGVLVLGVIAYQFGFSRGKAAGFDEGVRQQLGQETARSTTRAVQDPLAPTTPQAAPPQPVTPVVTASAPLDPAPAGGDPRRKGAWYFRIVTGATQAGGEALVAFCRENGLDARMVSDDNGKSRKIVVLPGLAGPEARKTSDGQALEAKIKSVGQRWKAKAKGNRSFDDAQLEPYR